MSERTDEELLEVATGADAVPAERARDELFRRHYPRVAAWCLRLTGDRDEAAELAQEVFLRAHTRLEGFRGEARFTTWLYQVTRSVAINRAQARARRPASSLEEETMPEVADDSPLAPDVLADEELRVRFRRALREELGALEGKVVYLHYVLGMTLERITRQLELTNASGAKAYVVSARRKLTRSFARTFATTPDAASGRQGGGR